MCTLHGAVLNFLIAAGFRNYATITSYRARRVHEKISRESRTFHVRTFAYCHLRLLESKVPKNVARFLYMSKLIDVQLADDARCNYRVILQLWSR